MSDSFSRTTARRLRIPNKRFRDRLEVDLRCARGLRVEVIDGVAVGLKNVRARRREV